MNSAIPSTVFPARGASWRPLALVAALVAAGCSQQEEITTYETPRVEPRAVAVDADEVRHAIDHMFTAIVPAGDVAWFFKLVARGDAADAVRKPFEDFVATVNVKPGDKLPAWKLPEGWSEGEGGELRAATIFVPHGEEKLELTVSSLSLSASWEAFLKSNVDRWMGQLQQPSLSAAKIDELKREIETASGKATLLELVGTMQRNPMGMAGGGMPAGHPPIGAKGTASPPPDEAQAAEPPVAPPAPSGGVAYDAPAGWEPGPPGAMRKASFTIKAEGGAAEAALFVFPNVREMADPRSNAIRWAGAVKLSNLSDDDIEAAHSEVDFAGMTGHKYEFYSPEGAPEAQGILAALAVQDEQVWSIKLTGDRAVVESQREAFDAFLKSLKLPSQP